MGAFHPARIASVIRATDLALSRGTRRFSKARASPCTPATRRAGRRQRLRQVEPLRGDSPRAPARRRQHRAARRRGRSRTSRRRRHPRRRSALDFVLDGDRELREIEAGLAAAEPIRRTTGALAELHHRFEAIGGYSARARAATLLAGLGFAEARHGDPVASFSGGWRMRLNLAQALQCALGPPAARRAHQSPRPRRRAVARGLARQVSGHAASHHARPRLPRRRGRRHRAHRQPQARFVHRQLRAVRARARATARAAAGDVRQAAAADRAPASRSSTASAPRPPRRSRRKAASRRSSAWS